MKTYEELLSDIEEDMELMGSSHIVSDFMSCHQIAHIS